MPKIIAAPNTEKIVCRVCGCVYEKEIHESFDECTVSYGDHNIVYGELAMFCPLCGHTNKVKLTGELTATQEV